MESFTNRCLTGKIAHKIRRKIFGSESNFQCAQIPSQHLKNYTWKDGIKNGKRVL